MPRRILDDHMPDLNDSSLRVILVITRQTLGWRTADGSRKKREWISHRWLQKMTGRSGSSVSAAIDGLVRQGLILVTDGHGRELRTKEARRAHRGRLYFELAEVGHLERPARMNWQRSETGVVNPKTIKETEVKEKNSKPVIHTTEKGWKSAASIAGTSRCTAGNFGVRSDNGKRISLVFRQPFHSPRTPATFTERERIQ